MPFLILEFLKSWLSKMSKMGFKSSAGGIQRPFRHWNLHWKIVKFNNGKSTKQFKSSSSKVLNNKLALMLIHIWFHLCTLHFWGQRIRFQCCSAFVIGFSTVLAVDLRPFQSWLIWQVLRFKNKIWKNGDNFSTVENIFNWTTI